MVYLSWPKMKLATLYDGDDWDNQAPSLKPISLAVMADIDSNLRELDSNGGFYRLPSTNYVGGGVFRGYWYFDHDQNNWAKSQDELRPDVIWDRLALHSGGIVDPQTLALKQTLEAEMRKKLVNSLEFTQFISSKTNQFVAFKDYMVGTELFTKPQTHSYERRIVKKAQFGSGGNQVSVHEPGEAIEFRAGDLAQEFIDGRSEAGELRDYRVVYFGTEPVFSLSRIAKPGSFHTNFHQGASVEYNQLEDIGPILKFAAPIAERMSIFSQPIMSLDFMRERKTGRYYLIEINNMPAFRHYLSDPESKRLMNTTVAKLVQYFLGKA